jgi:hypothetical protein
MFNIATLKTSLAGLIGFRDSQDGSVPKIDTDIKASSSGQYWDDFHPLLLTDNLFFSAPNFEAMNYSTWTQATHDAGDQVVYQSVAWRSMTGSNTATPSVGTLWETEFSLWLRDKTNSSIAKLFNRLQTNKKLSGSTKAIFDSLHLFEGDGRLSDTITKSNRLVGFAITLRKVNNIRGIIKQLGLQFSAAQTNLPIYLWHSSRKGYVVTQNVTTTGTNKFNWQSMTGFNLDYVNYTDDIDAGGTWYIGYFESAVTGNAVNKAYDFYAGPCIGCGGNEGNITKFNLWSKYVEIMPFYVDNSKLDGTNLPAIEDIQYDESTNFGLNLALTVKPDLTELIVNNTSLITNALGLQFASDTLEWILMNPSVRVNANRINAEKSAIDYALVGSKDTNRKGLMKEAEDAINALAIDLSNLSAALPANKPTGIRIGAI